MALSSPEIRELCNAREWALIQASQPGAIEKLSSTELKKHADNAQKLVTKWQDLSRSQARTESRKSGSPNLDSRSHEKHEAFKTALAAFRTQLATSEAAPASSASKSKPTPKARSIAARSDRRSTRKTLHRAKKSLNQAAAPLASKPAAKPAAAPAVAAAAKPATKKKPAAKSKATKTTKLAAERKKRAAAIAAAPPTAKPPKAIKVNATAAKQAGLAGKVKSTRTAISVRTNKIAGHVSGKGKRVQGKRDARGR